MEKKDEAIERGKRIAGELKLALRYYSNKSSDGYYADSDIHKLLGSSVEVFCHHETPSNPNHQSEWHHDPTVDASRGAKRKALLIAIRPIVEKTPEYILIKNLRDLLWRDNLYADLVAQADAILAKK